MIATIGTAGDVCLYTSVAAHYVMDSPDTSRPGRTPDSPAPQRCWTHKPGETTADGHFAGIGAVAGGTAITVVVAGRVAPNDAESVVLNVTVTDPQAPGFATSTRVMWLVQRHQTSTSPLANTIANAVVTTLSNNGFVCLYTHSTAHFIIDVAGALPSSTFQALAAPQRMLETRPRAKRQATVSFKG